MIETPRITQLEATDFAYIHLTIPKEKMAEVFGPTVEELMSTLAAQGVEPTGAVFAHHLGMSETTFNFEVGVPTGERVSPEGRVEPGERPAVEVAQTVYHGPYEGLPDAWGEFHEWIDDNDLDYASDIWEVYLVGPESSDDPSDWRTELNRPLVDSDD